MTTWFISDLHLEPVRPESTQLLFAFLQHIRGQAEALYILGDLFEYWIGDDVLATPAGQMILPILQAFKQVVTQGTPIYLQHGNRDFLLAEQFAELSAIKLLPEQQVIDLYGEPTLIMHGDLLCTDDLDYQKARVLLRSPSWQQQILAKSIPERLQFAQSLRMQSQQTAQTKQEEILDANQTAIEAAMQTAQVKQLIHGHTHRPAIHEFELAGQSAKRIVLGDWYQQGSFLRVHASGLRLSTEFY
ncbi:MAG: UDP-2,3-diacylglucosamine diphosphatase [Thiothrix sp.]|nr:MAG: UDP-2,3-diacylglucosamine diphosphatase [Thiothrix sp.]